MTRTRSTKHRRRWAWPLALILATFALTSPAGAAEGTCSYGDARRLQQSYAPFLHQPRDTFLPDCQYRVFFDGAEFTFHDDDWFLAGVVLYWEYEQLGVSRQAGIDELDRLQVRVWLAPIDADGTAGEAQELDLERSSYRDIESPLGHLVYTNIGAILHLPVGDYLSTEQITLDGELVQTDHVTLHVVPRDAS